MEGVKSDMVFMKYDSETTSNNEHIPDHIKYGIDQNMPPQRGRK